MASRKRKPRPDLLLTTLLAVATESLAQVRKRDARLVELITVFAALQRARRINPRPGKAKRAARNAATATSLLPSATARGAVFHPTTARRPRP